MNRKEAIEHILKHANDEIMDEIEHFRDVYEDNKEDLNQDGEFRDTLVFFEFVLDEFSDVKPTQRGTAKNLKELMVGIGMCEELQDWQLKTMVVMGGDGRKYDFILNGKKYDCNSICAMDYYTEEPLKEEEDYRKSARAYRGVD